MHSHFPTTSTDNGMALINDQNHAALLCRRCNHSLSLPRFDNGQPLEHKCPICNYQVVYTSQSLFTCIVPYDVSHVQPLRFFPVIWLWSAFGINMSDMQLPRRVHKPVAVYSFIILLFQIRFQKTIVFNF